MGEVFIVVLSWGTPKHEEISGVYANGLDALMHEAGRIAWTAADEVTDGVLFTGLGPTVADEYRIEKWTVE